MRKTNRLGSVVFALLSVLAVLSPAVAADPPARGGTPAHVDSVTIQGDAVVGSTLTATPSVTGDPAPKVSYQWGRCGPTKPTDCKSIDGAQSATYAVVSADVGNRLIVRVTAKNSAGPGNDLTSDPTAAVTAPSDPPPSDPPPPKPPKPPKQPPDPTPTPAPTPAPTPPPSDPPPAPVTVAPPASSPAVGVGAPTTPLTPVLPQPQYLHPFPVVRIKGASVAGGARIDLLRVTAPRTAMVHVSCSGKRCPLRRLTLRSGRIRPFERFLPAGLAVTIRVTRTGYIGKYVRFIVRSSAAPERHDACLLPTSSRPRRCPT